MKRVLYLFIYTSVLLATISVSAQPGDPGGGDPDFDLVPDHIELAVLKSIYDSLGGGNWTNKTNWPLPGQWPSSATSTEFDSWYGIGVSNGDITSIDLTQNSLVGSIPASLTTLSSLKYLNLTLNQLNGSIPSDFGNLSNLETLRLNSNDLEGIIPPSLGDLITLKNLDLGYNQLSGTIPASLGDIDSLRKLYLANNQLSGQIPSSLGNLQNLESLYLSGNALTGPIPPELGNLSKLELLYLHLNELSGEIPSALGNLVSLKTLTLEVNNLSGTIPASIGSLTNLTDFWANANQLSGVLPSSLGSLVNLRTLVLSDNLLSGSVPHQLSNLTSLQYLRFDSNQFSGSISFLGGLTNLTQVSLSSNQFSGEIPSSIGNLTSLTSLNLIGNQLSGSIPSSLGNLLNLQSLEMSYNQLTGSIPATLGNLNNLWLLRLNTNQLSGEVPAELSSMEKLSSLSLHSNQLSGYFPVQFVNMPQLRYLSTNDNELTGLPDFSSHLNKNLLQLLVANNRLDFSDLEIFFTGGGTHPFQTFTYSPQKKFNATTPQVVVNGNELVIPGIGSGQNLSVIWEKKNSSGSWVNVNAGNEDISQITFTKNNATKSDGGTYRWRTTSSSVPGLTLESEPIMVSILTQINTVDPFAFKYKYDHRRRMTHKKVPGADWVYMVYDNRDRLVLTQDGNQRSSNQWNFTKYDELNRPVLTGIYTHSASVDQAEMQDEVNDFYDLNINPNNRFFEVRGSTVHGYTSQSFPNTVTNEADYLTVTYYDDYAFDEPSSLTYDENELAAEGQEQDEFTRVKGLVTGTKVKNLDDNSWLWTVNYYDDKYRFIQSVSQNHRGGTDRITNVYDFVGKVLHTKTTHSITGSTETSITRSFDYDHAGRLLQMTHQAGNSTPVVLAENRYNELGQLVTKNLHISPVGGGQEGVQQVDYRYNIRGWLTRINNSDLSILEDGGPSDYFGMELAYNNFFDGFTNTPQYNGNISAVKWSNSIGLGIVKENAYLYSYDPMNRISDAGFRQNKSGVWGLPEHKIINENDEEETVSSEAFTETGYAYDLNGNILSMKRFTKKGGLMDFLDYNYVDTNGNASNQLLSVSELDGGDVEKGFVDGNTSDDDYLYDPNGNMIEDKNKDITSIEYNHLNLPKKVTKGTGEYIKYIYDATGRKLSQEVYAASGSTPEKKSDYLGEFFYENDELKFINHEEGRIVIPPSGGTEGGEYQYHMKDHLGNVRLTFTTKEDTELNLATLETQNADDEQAQFLYYDEAVKINSFLFDHTHRVSGGGSGPNVPVTGVTLPTSGITMKVGQTTAMNEMIEPSNASNKDVTWSSANTSVATVNANGEVTAISAGTSTVTVTTVDGSFTTSLLVTVAASNNLVQNFEFNQGTTGWTLIDNTGDGNTWSVVQGAGLSGDNAAYVDVTGDNNIAWYLQLRQTLNFNLVQGKTYEISYVARAESPRQVSLVLHGYTLNTTYLYRTDNISTVAKTIGPFQYTCNNANAASESIFHLRFDLARGVISDVWIDKVIITEVTTGGGPVTDIRLTPETLTLPAGQVSQLTKVILPTNATNQNVTWTSSDESVATVTNTGLVRAVSSGVATITATTQDGGYTGTSVVTVKRAGSNAVKNHEFDNGLSDWILNDWTGGGNTLSVVQGEGLSGNNAAHVDVVTAHNGGYHLQLVQPLDFDFEQGRTYEISYVARAESPRPVSVVLYGQDLGTTLYYRTDNISTDTKTYGPFQYTCNNPDIASESNVLLRFDLAKGVISDVWIDNVIISDITDGPGAVAGLSITPKLSLTNGQSEQLQKIITPSNAANQVVNWSSNNTGIATVSSDGTVTARSPGAAIITAITEDGGFVSQCYLAVAPGGSNISMNSEFDEGLSNWILYDWAGGGASASVVQGAGLSGNNSVRVDVVNTNSTPWALQLRQTLNFSLELGRTYEISFMAKAESSRTIDIALMGEEAGQQTTYSYRTVDLTTTPQLISYQYTVTNANAENESIFSLRFHLSKGVINDVWLDKVIIRDLSAGGTNPAFHHLEAEGYTSQSGISISGGSVTSLNDTDWLSFSNIDLTGVKELKARFATTNTTARFELRLGSTTGTLVASMPCVNTGNTSTYKEFVVPVTETTGLHNLYVVFQGSSNMNLDWIELLGETVPIVVTDVSISPNNPTVYKGQTIRLSKNITPTDASNHNVTWTSSDTNIATVNANGDVTGIEVGTATITATTEDGNKTDQITVTIAESTAGTFYSTRLSGSPTERYGLAKSLSVMPGDVVKMEVFAKYLDANSTNWTALLNNLIISLSVPSGGNYIDGGGAGSLGNETLPFTPIDHINDDDDDGPKAYLNYILMDREFGQVLDMGYRKVTEAARETGTNVSHERLFFDDILIKEAGYMYIYISNEGEELVDVFFDDLKVEHVKSPIIQSDDYYPFGLTFNSYQRENSVENRYLYNQGTGEKTFHTERVFDLELNVDQSKYRTYDYTTGRWWQVDPLADEGDLVSLTPYNYSYNNPILYNDPEGDCPQCIWGAIIGAAVDYGTQVAVNLVQGKDLGDALTDVDGGSILLSAGVGALTGGLSALKGASGAVKVADAVADVAKAGDKVADVAKTVDKVADVASVTKNAQTGAQFEKTVVTNLEKSGHKNISQQVTVKAENGVKTRVDVVSKDAGGKVKLTEAKSSQSAPLTKNQKSAFPSIEQKGGTVVGKGKPGFEGGTKIPPTKVEIVRPN